MSKVVITSIDQDKVSYIEGEEVEVTVDFIKSRLAEIDSILSADRQDPLSFNKEIAEVEDRVEEAIAKKKAEVEDKQSVLGKELEDFITLILSQKEMKVSSIKAKALEISNDEAELIKERNMLSAILSNVPSALEEETEAIPESEEIQDSEDEDEAVKIHVPEDEELKAEPEEVEPETISEPIQQPITPVVENIPEPKVEEEVLTPVEAPRKKIIF